MASVTKVCALSGIEVTRIEHDLEPLISLSMGDEALLLMLPMDAAIELAELLNNQTWHLKVQQIGREEAAA